MPWQKSFQQRFRWKRWCRLRAAPKLSPRPGHTTGICFFVPFLMAVTVLDVASRSATSGMGGGHLPPPPAAATCPPWGQLCHQLCPLPCSVHIPKHTQLLLLVQASLKTRRHPYLSAGTLQVPMLLLPCPRGMLCFAKAMQNMQQVSPLSPAGHVTTSRTLFFPNSCDKLCFLPLHASTHMLCHSRAICCCCSAGAGRGSSQLLAQPRTLETRKPFPHVLRLGEGLHQVLDIFCPSHPSLQPISLLFPNFLLFLSSMLCVFFPLSTTCSSPQSLDLPVPPFPLCSSTMP